MLSLPRSVAKTLLSAFPTLLSAVPATRFAIPTMFIAGALLIPGALLLTPIPGAAQQGNPCTSAEAGQFDFWIGDWEVLQPNGDVAGHNKIEKILNGCVLKESYVTPGGYAGESFNIFDASRGVWHQSWVDVGGLLLLLEGGFLDGAMVLSGEVMGEGGPVRQRITWSKVAGDPDRIRQLWETSPDGGETWGVAFDGLYVRKTGGS